MNLGTLFISFFRNQRVPYRAPNTVSEGDWNSKTSPKLESETVFWAMVVKINPDGSGKWMFISLKMVLVGIDS